MLQRLAHPGGKPQLIERQLVLRIKQSQHQLLAGHSRVGGDANIAGQTHLVGGNPAVLRQRLDVGLELGQVLDSAENQLGRLNRQGADMGEHTVEPELHAAPFTVHVQMHVAGLVPGGELQKPLDRRGGVLPLQWRRPVKGLGLWIHLHCVDKTVDFTQLLSITTN